MPVPKLFRVVAIETTEDLTRKLRTFEYNEDVYVDQPSSETPTYVLWGARDASVIRRSTDGITFPVSAQVTPPETLTYLWVDEWDGVSVCIIAASTHVYISADAAATWTRTAADLPRAGTSLIRHRGTGALVAGLINGGNGVEIARSTDGGASWSTIQIDSRSAAFSRPEDATLWETNDGALLLGTHMQVSGNNGRIYRSTDGGAVWSQVHENSDATATALYLTYQPRIGMAFAYTTGNEMGQVFLRSADHGLTWAPVLSVLNYQFISGAIPHSMVLRHHASGRLIIPAGIPFGNPTAFISEDQGASWQENSNYRTPYGVPPAGAAWQSSQAIFCCKDIGAGGYRLFRSLTGGTTWEEPPEGSDRMAWIYEWAS